MNTFAVVKIEGEVFLYSTTFSELTLRQSIGQHHHCEVNIRPNPTSSEKFLYDRSLEWIGKKISINAGESTEDKYHDMPSLPAFFEGFITDVLLHCYGEDYQLVIQAKSPTIALDAGPKMRSFADKTLSNIVSQVLGDYKKTTFSKEPIIKPRYTKPLPYIVQYKESDWQFLGRLAARYGEWLYYDGLQLYFGAAPEANKIGNKQEDSLNLKNFQFAVKAVPNGFKLSAYDYRAHQPISINSDFTKDAKMHPLAKDLMSKSAENIYPKHPEAYVAQTVDNEELQDMVNRREQAYVQDMIQLSGSSSNETLKLGTVIRFNDKVLSGAQTGTFHLLNLVHSFGQKGYYNNRFTAVPSMVSVPNLTQSLTPPYCENQVGEVVQVNDGDQLGRVRVKLGWQQDVKADDLPWIRVASPSAGKNSGIYFLPEVGAQVLVAFEQQHPEKPYVLSSFYHSENKPQNPHSHNLYKGIRTKGQNSILFYDKKDTQSLQLYSPNLVSIKAGKAIELETEEDGKITINAGDSGEITIIAKKIVIKSQELEIDGAKTQFKGQSITIEGSGQIKIKGGTIDLTA